MDHSDRGGAGGRIDPVFPAGQDTGTAEEGEKEAGDIYEYIPKINVMLSKYRESEKDFAEIRKLERKMEDFYEQARMVIFAYIESKQFIEEQILEDIGVTSLDFEKHVKLVEAVAPRLYNQYLSPIKIKYNF